MTRADAYLVLYGVAGWSGALLAELGTANDGRLLVIAAGVIGVSAMIAARARPALVALRIAAVCVVIACVCAAAMMRARNGIEHHSLVGPIGERAAIELRGEIADDAATTRFASSALLRVHEVRIRRGPWIKGARTILLRGTGKRSGAVGVLEATDVVEVTGDIGPLEGFDARWRWKHAVGQLVVAEVHDLRSGDAFWQRASNALRSVIKRGLRVLPSEDRALLDGLLLGDTRQISDLTINDFRAAGLSHLLAVSGANVAFVLAVFGPLIRRAPLGWRFIIGVGVVGLFAAMTRFEPSVLRASVMAAVVMTARLWGRPVAALRALVYAVVLLVVIDPFLVHSVGFQLSVAACCGIVALSAPLEARIPGPRLIRSAIALSVAAQVGVAPVVFATFGETAWVAPAANLFAAPAAEPITVVGLPLAAIAAAVPWLGRLGLVPVQWMLGWVRAVGEAAAVRPGVVWTGAAVVLLGAWRLDSTP